jgi:hypothetical protein
MEAAESIEQNLRTGLGVAGLRFPQRHLSWGVGGNGVGHGAAFIAGRPPALRFTSKPKRRSVEIHHVNGDPMHNRIVNTIPLCRDCHHKATFPGI